MTLWYNDPRKNQTIGTIKGSYDNAASSFIVNEGRIIKNESTYYFVGLFEGATDVQKYGEKDFALDNVIATLTFHSEKYQKSVKSANGEYVKEDVEPTELEKVLCKEFDSLLSDPLFEGKALQGELNLLDNGNLINALAVGKVIKRGELVELTDTEIDIYRDQLFSFQPIEINKLTDDLIKEVSEQRSSFNNKKGGGNTYNNFQAEKDRLEERFQFLKEKLSPYSDDATSLVELAIVVNQMEKEIGNSTVLTLNLLIAFFK